MAVPRQLVAEFAGTMLLLATVIGSGIMAERLAGGNIAVALLGNTIPTGAILYVLITIFGPVSGAHFNPAVTLAFFIRRQIPVKLALLFVVMQIIGGMCGAFLAHFMFEMPILQMSTNLRTGPAQWGAEFVATFGLADRDFWRHTLAARRGANAGCAVHHGGLLVYQLDKLCQSGSYHRAQLYRQFFGYSAGACTGLYHRAAGRCDCRTAAVGLVVHRRRKRLTA
jgi:hypothetical protein